MRGKGGAFQWGRFPVLSQPFMHGEPHHEPSERRHTVGSPLSVSLASWLRQRRSCCFSGGRTVEALVERTERLAEHRDRQQASGKQPARVVSYVRPVTRPDLVGVGE